MMCKCYATELKVKFCVTLISKDHFKLYHAPVFSDVILSQCQRKTWPCCSSSVRWSGTGLDGQILWQYGTKSHCAKRNPNPEDYNDQQADRPCISIRLILLVTETADQLKVCIFKPVWLWCVCLYPGWGGFSPLHYAALHGNRALVDIFLSNGADPNLTCDAGQTAFHFACRWAIVAH